MLQGERAADAAIHVAERWYESHRSARGNVNTNVMTSGIAVAELLRSDFPLTAESIKSERNSQVKGLSGSLVKRVLEAHGERRRFTAEGGRTSRGTLPLATEFALGVSEVLAAYDIGQRERCEIADRLQSFFVKRIQADYFDKKRISVSIDCRKPVSEIVADVLEAAKLRADKPTGVVAQHLVGAKLEMRFPSIDIGRERVNAADLQTNRQGDFQVGSAAFHVTMAPSSKLVDRARENISQGFRPVVLVPRSSVPFALGLFGSEGMGDAVHVQSIESYVGTNVEEMMCYDSDGIHDGVACLVRRYNERIRCCENDQSLQLEEPAWIAEKFDISYGYSPL